MHMYCINIGLESDVCQRRLIGHKAICRHYVYTQREIPEYQNSFSDPHNSFVDLTRDSNEDSNSFKIFNIRVPNITELKIKRKFELSTAIHTQYILCTVLVHSTNTAVHNTHSSQYTAEYTIIKYTKNTEYTIINFFLLINKKKINVAPSQVPILGRVIPL